MPAHPGETLSTPSSPPASAATETRTCPEAPAPAGPALGRYLPLTVQSAAASLDAGGVAVLNSALPSVGAQFGTSAQNLSWAVTGYALAFAGLLLCGGAMADRLRQPAWSSAAWSPMPSAGAGCSPCKPWQP